jgi:chemotaxis protein methyltransferase CheR
MAFTYFFRDRHTLDLIARHVIPDLKKRMYINIWDAGCAMGPEPYSLAITLRENMGPFLFRNVRIYATDVDESGEFGQVIARGVYPTTRVKRIPLELLRKYFTPTAPSNGGEGLYEISAEMKKAVIYQRHDLLSLRPIRDEFGLVVCKNVLLHFQPQERVAVIEMFHRALSQGGYFVTEQTQKLPPEVAHLFRGVTSAGQLFQKVSHPVEKATPEPDQPGRTRVTAIQIKQDQSFAQVSDYTWLNIDADGHRIGKARVCIMGNRLTIHSLTIFPEFARNGCAQKVIELFQECYQEIVADRVRNTAKGFWERMGFEVEEDGDYVWKKEEGSVGAP